MGGGKMTVYARVPDTSRYYGHDGLNWPVILDTTDGIIFCAGVGTVMDYALEESVNNAVRYNHPYATYHIPRPVSMGGAPMPEQMEIYLSWPGVRDALCIMDFEPPRFGDPRMVSGAEAVQCMREIDRLHDLAPWWYSNLDSVAKMAWPRALQEYNLIAAQWLYNPATGSQYEDYESFLARYAGRNAPWTDGTIYSICSLGWQFTKAGKRPDIAQRNTGGGIKLEHDFSTSTIDRDAFMAMFWHGETTPPPEPPEVIMQKWEIVSDSANVRTLPKDLPNSRVIAVLGRGAKVTGTGNHDARPEWPHQHWVEIIFGEGTAWMAEQYYSDGKILMKTVS